MNTEKPSIDDDPVENIELGDHGGQYSIGIRSRPSIGRQLSNTAQNYAELRPKHQHRDESIVDILNEFGNFVSASGLPRACKTENGTLKRIFYALIFLVSFALGLFFGLELIGDYLDYPVIVNIEINTQASSEFPSVTICNTNRVRESAIRKARDSSLAYLLDVGRTFNGLYYEPCLEGDHYCDQESLCLRKFKVCDGYRDCSDASDEGTECYYGKCGSLQHRCASGGLMGVCMDNSFVCNGIAECYDDSSDEENCNSADNCQGFLCNVTLECIASSKVCDSIYDCGDGSDEVYGCALLEEEYSDDTGVYCIGEYTWECADKTCIFPDWVCDGIKDCPDGSDESSEYAKCTNSPTGVDGSVLGPSLEISTLFPSEMESSPFYETVFQDSIFEENDTTLGESIFPTILSSIIENLLTADTIDVNGEEYIVCDGGLFIPIYFKCDAFKDCIDGSDELNCDGDTDLNVGEDGNSTSSFNTTLDELFAAGWSEPYHDITQDSEIYDLFESLYRDQYNTGFERVPDTDPPSWDDFVTFSNTGDFSDLGSVLELTLEEVQEYGHQASDMIIQCSFDQRVCRPEEFYQYQDDKYGNCYTFNHPEKNDPAYIATGSGPSHGLKLTLFTEQEEYVSIYGQDSGIITAIHPRDERPFPETSGILASPGRATFIGVKQTKITRLEDPYGNCTNTENSEFGGSYTLSSCRLKCLQNYLNSQCGCYDTILLNESIPRCHFLNFKQEQCRQLMYYLQYQNLLDCSECLEPCSEIIYSKTTSSSEWPSQKFMDHIIRAVHTANEKTKDINDNYTAWRNLARIEVYFEDLTFQEIIEKKKFNGPWDLMSQVGGVIGLYIGLSIITVVEFLELIYMLVIFAFKKFLIVGHLNKRTSPGA